MPVTISNQGPGPVGRYSDETGSCTRPRDLFLQRLNVVLSMFYDTPILQVHPPLLTHYASSHCLSLQYRNSVLALSVNFLLQNYTEENKNLVAIPSKKNLKQHNNEPCFGILLHWNIRGAHLSCSILSFLMCRRCFLENALHYV